MSKRIFMGFIGAVAFALTLGLSSVSQAGPPTICGDAVIEGLELCDDGNTVDGDLCSSDCIPEICGDGILENNGALPDEECDDGNTTSADGCENDCTETPPVCGDGIVHSTEECDDGNTIDDDACANDCTENPICGDGIVSGTEECDDGNTVAGDGCENDCTNTPGAVDYTPTKDDQKCVNGINKGWAGVTKATGKVSGKCVKNISKGKVTGDFSACAVVGEVGKSFDKTTKADQKSCPPAAEMFAYIGDPNVVNLGAFDNALLAETRLLGSTSNIVPKDDKDNAKCQQEIQKGLIKYLDGLSSDANKAKKDCLKGKKVAQCLNSGSLATAMTTDGTKGTKALSKWNTKADKKCASLSVEAIPANFPGDCRNSATYTELVGCSARYARCTFCASLNTADGLSVDCDAYADSTATGSCDPLPATTTTVVGTTTTSSGTTTTSSGTTTTSSGTTTTSSGTTTTSGATTTTVP